MNVNFVVYDTAGEIIMVGNELDKHVQARLDAGENVIVTDGPVPLGGVKVDLATLTIVPKETDLGFHAQNNLSNNITL